MASSPEPGDKVDGRRRRAADSRARIVAALLELVRVDGVAPGAERVAARAGVGLRTVFRLFKDMDALYREMSAVIAREAEAIIGPPLVEPPGRDRLHAMIDRRVRLFERVLPFQRAAASQRAHSPFLQADHAGLQVALRRALCDALPPRPDPLVLEALDLLLGIEAWIRLRIDQGLEPETACRVLHAAADRLLP